MTGNYILYHGTMSPMIFCYSPNFQSIWKMSVYTHKILLNSSICRKGKCFLIGWQFCRSNDSNLHSLLCCSLLLLLLHLLLLLFLHYPIRISAFLVALLYPALSCATCHHLTIPIFFMSFSTSSFHLVLGLPLGHFWCKLAWYIILVFLASSVCCGCHCGCSDLLFSVVVPISGWCKKKFKCFLTLFQSICKTFTFSTMCHLFVLVFFLINFLKQFTWGFIYCNGNHTTQNQALFFLYFV